MSQTHHLAATPDTVAWGHLDARRGHVLEIDSGDEVVIETISGEPWDLPEDESLILSDHNAVLDAQRKEFGEGVHHLTGPVFVRNAEPGDVLQIDILEAKPRQDWGFCQILPLKGILPKEFTNYQTQHIRIDREKGTAITPWGVEFELDPFFGIMSVAPPPAWGRLSSPMPWEFGGNIDNKELKPGTTLYLPVFNKGALFSAGDGHGRQGDGEVCIDALETALTGRFRLTVRKDLGYERPFAESETHLISIGLANDLDGAAASAVREMVDHIISRSAMDRDQAYMMCSMVGDLSVTQVVNGNKGVRMMYDKRYL